MSELSTHSKVHNRITTFVDWIKPDPEKRDEIKKKANNVRDVLKTKAESGDYNLVVVATPNAGSFSTKAGLRKHYRGDAEVEGLDVDIPFVVKDNIDGYKLNDLLSLFYDIVDDCYPDTEKKATKSSIKLKFTDGVNLDIVPLLEGATSEKQILIRSTGERINTSVQKQIDFIKSRTNSSNQEVGRVKFNECLRLLKWWRDFEANDSYYLGDDNSPPSFLINLLAAKAFDELSVEKTYAETLAKWFGYLAHVTRNKAPILFMDYNSPSKDVLANWTVKDPVNPDNNVVESWDNSKIDELASWFERGRDNWSRVIRFDLDGDDSKSLDHLVKIFGNSFKNHCD